MELAPGSLMNYVLPVPPGHWVPAIECKVYRKLCPRQPCQATGCPQIPCLSDEAPLNTTCMTNTTDNVDSCSPSGSCQPPTANQPCDWRTSPDLVGKMVYVLPLGSHSQDYPFVCAPGIRGGSNPSEQTSATCAGFCPAGFTCGGGEEGVEPVACPEAHYCPEGSSIALPCPAGTHSNANNLTSAGDCTPTTPGYFTTTGSTEQTPCPPGTQQPESKKGQCDPCDAGKYAENEGATACMVCGEGSYSSNVLSCEECPVREFCPAGATQGTPCPVGSTTDGVGSRSLADCGCYEGMYDASGDLTCVDCTTGMNCTAANTGVEDLPLAAGYWRQHYWSAPPEGSVRPCFTEEACLGGTNLSVDAFCAPSQQGPYCAVCRDGYFGGGDGALCTPCEGSSFLTFLPTVIITIMVVMVLVYLLASCYRGEDVLDKLAHGGSALADALAEELEGANPTSTFAVFEGVTHKLVEEVGVEATSRAKDQALRTMADKLETQSVKARLEAAKEKDDNNERARLEAATEQTYPKTTARVRWLQQKAEGFGVKLKILIALYQMLQGIGITFDIRYPKMYADVLRFLSSIIQIDLPQAMPLDCVASFGFFGALVVRTAIPLLIILLLAGVSAVLRKCNRANIAEMCSSGWFILLFLVYPSCSSACFQAFM